MMSIAPPSSKKAMQSNSPSKLLSHEENETLFKILGNRCQTQVSAVVQVFGTDPPNHGSWIKRHCGVATFTKDNSRRSYFIQVFDIVKEQKIFEQEVYNLFSYHVSLPFFHQFEAENQMIGLNFADNQEAEAFNKVISDRLASKQRKREERRRQQQQEFNQHQHNAPPHQNQNKQNLGLPNNASPSLSSSSQSLNIVRKKGKKTNKLSKDQIGVPMNFQHITHVGFDQDTGFSSFNANDELNDFFKMAGVSQKLLQDDNTRKFIYDFIDQHGGVERAAQETKVYGSIKKTPSSSDPQNRPALPSRNSISGGVAPPPPPPRPQNPPQAAPPPPPKDRAFPERANAPPPPPPPQPPVPPPPSGSHHLGGGSGNAAPPPPPPPPRMPMSNGVIPTQPNIPPSDGFVPPPPPPPPVGGHHPPPPPAMATHVNPDAKVRVDLFAQIRQRPALNPVSQQKKPERIEQDTRTTLMSEIRNREYELKPVSLHDGETSPGLPSPAENTMAAMLARALEGRAKVIQNESDSDGEEDEDEDEWDES